MRPGPDAMFHTWSELPIDRPMPLIERQRIVGEQAMISRVRLLKGFHLRAHSHANEQFACVLEGRVRFGIGVEGSPGRLERVIGAGEVLQLPANVPHSAEALEDSILLDIFSPPSATTGVDRPG